MCEECGLIERYVLNEENNRYEYIGDLEQDLLRTGVSPKHIQKMNLELVQEKFPYGLYLQMARVIADWLNYQKLWDLHERKPIDRLFRISIPSRRPADTINTV